MPYTIRSYQGINSNITVNDLQIDSGSVSITLIGKDVSPYGEIVQTDLYNMMEHFCGPVPPTNPVIGQIWYDTNTNELKVYTISNTWESLSSINSGGTLPSSGNNVGQLFFHNNSPDKILYVWDGTRWVNINGVIVSPTAPTSPHNGMIWYDTTDTNFYIFVNGSWRKVLSSSNFNDKSDSSVIDFVKIDNPPTNVNIGVIELNSDIVALFSEQTVNPADFGSTTYTTKDGSSTIQYSVAFPEGIEEGLNLRSNFTKVNFEGNTVAEINQKNTDPNARLSFKVGGIESLRLKNNEIQTYKPIIAQNSDFIKLPAGGDGQRPATPLPGSVRFNTSDNSLEYYNGTEWVKLKKGGNVIEGVMTQIHGNRWELVHGLGTPPRMFQVVMRFTTSQGGYSPGDEVDVLSLDDQDEASGTHQHHIAVWADNNVIGFSKGSNQGYWRMATKNGGWWGFFTVNFSGVEMIARYIP